MCNIARMPFLKQQLAASACKFKGTSADSIVKSAAAQVCTLMHAIKSQLS